MKNILGLDLGTNSIGWALVCIDDEKRLVTIRAIGSRIIPMDEGELSTFAEGGKVKSTAAAKSEKKSARKLRYRFAIRRDRLNCVLYLLGMLPAHYKIELYNEKGVRTGKTLDKDAKIAYYRNASGKWEFLFNDSYNEMLSEFAEVHPELFINKRGENAKIPYDWTLFYLRKKAQYTKINLDELAWVLMSYNQRRGYEPVSGTEKSAAEENKIVEELTYQVASAPYVIQKDTRSSKTFGYKNSDGDVYRVDLINPTLGKESTIAYSYYLQNEQLPAVGDIVIITSTSILEDGEVNDAKTTYTLSEIVEVDGEQKLKKTVFTSNGTLKKKATIVKIEENDWKALKAKKESEIEEYNREHDAIGIAEYTYARLLENPSIKIHGELYSTIERDFYREELKQIIKIQATYHDVLGSADKYNQIIDVLYPHNPSHHDSALKQNIWEFITEDVIEYQRDLKSKKSEIADCRYERDGSANNKPLKAVHKSNPFYQEFRLWTFLSRVRIVRNECKDEKGEVVYNKNVTSIVLNKDKRAEVFTKMRVRKSFSQKQFLSLLGLSDSEYHWNYESDFEAQGDATHYEFLWRLKRIEGWNQQTAERFLSTRNGEQSVEYMLWHLFYSIKKVKTLRKALRKLIHKSLILADVPLSYLDAVFNKLIAFEGYTNDYGTYSEKAIKKMLPLMRCGSYWNRSEIEKLTLHQLSDKLLADEGINGEYEDFKGLQEHTCCYLLYGRYSEVGDAQKWSSPNDIKNYLRHNFKQGELRNPVVEKVVRETLNVVHDIWDYYGEKDTEGNVLPLFDEIHIELARELKKTPEQKKKDNIRNKQNQAANRHAYEMLKELKTMYDGIEPKSPNQQMKMRIYEDTVWQDTKLNEESFSDIAKNGDKIGLTYEEAQRCRYSVTHSELKKYILWLEQKYVSPYTGKFISLADLFDGNKYQIEHVLPQDRVTLNAMYNLVLCEAEVNKEKDNLTGLEFIRSRQNDEIELAWNHHEKVKVRTEEAYRKYVQETYKETKKKQILLSADIPDEFTNSQMNNTRYISKIVMKLMSNIVRDMNDPADMTSYRSKNVLALTGGVTTTLKHDWELDNAWNELIKNRFLRLNQLTQSELFGSIRTIHGRNVFVPDVPEFLRFEFDKKRIDHRHHAMDALVAALATNVHVNYLNNTSAGNDERHDIVNKYRYKNEQKSRAFMKPMWYKTVEDVVKYTYCYADSPSSERFSDVVLEALQNTIATFKQKDYRNIIRKRKNYYMAWDDAKGCICLKQEDNLGDLNKYNIRTALHKDTLYGKRAYMIIPLKEAISKCKIEDIQSKQIRALWNDAKVNGLTDADSILQYIEQKLGEEKRKYEYTQVLKPSITSRFTHTIQSLCSKGKNQKARYQACLKEIRSIYDLRIQQILLSHLKEHQDDPQLAFSTSGIRALNSTIQEKYNHKPIKAFTCARAFTGRAISAEAKDKVKKLQYVETAEGSNLLVGFYEDERGKRKFYVPTLEDTVISLKNGWSPLPEFHPTDSNYSLIFFLQVGDLVYMPSDIDKENGNIVSLDVSRIYKMTSCDKEHINFVPAYMASQIVNTKKVNEDEGSDETNNPAEAVDQKTVSFIKFYFAQDENGQKVTKEEQLLGELCLKTNKVCQQAIMNIDPCCFSGYGEKTTVKANCWKLEVDRLGNVKNN